MKKTYYIFLFVFVAIFLIVFTLMSSRKESFDPDITMLILQYENNRIEITDSLDLQKFEMVLTGNVYEDAPSCGFDSNYSIVLLNGLGTTKLYLALDGCPIMQINDTNRYLKLSEKNKLLLDDILSEYSYPLAKTH